MSVRAFVLGVLVSVVASAALAQMPKDAEKTLQSTLLKKQLFLRDFNADEDVRWHWENGSLVQTAPQVRTLAAVVVQSVKVKGNQIELRGERHSLMKKKDGSLFLSDPGSHVMLHVDLTGADGAAVLPKLLDLLAYPSSAAAIAALPVQFQRALPASVEPGCCRLTGDAANSGGAGPIDCASEIAETGRANYSVKKIGMKPPKLVKSVDPQFSEEARRAKFSGNVQVGLDVETTGRTANLWVIRGIGLGLDTKAAEAVSQYVFAPATCHDKPVATQLYIDVNFSIF